MGRIRHCLCASCLLQVGFAAGAGVTSASRLPGEEPNDCTIAVRPEAAPTCDADGRQDSGAMYRLCMPDPGRWNGELVVYAHGYVAPDRPIEIPDDQLGPPDGPSLAELANLLGFAFATTSYRTNGLAVSQGVDDLVDLVGIFIATYGDPTYVYLVGASEGGLITALAVERYPDMFDGGLAVCGPLGDFRAQLDYVGHFRVVFDHLFPGVIPGSVVNIPQAVIDNWDGIHVPDIMDAIDSDPEATEQLIQVTGAAVDWRDPASSEATVLGLLWYNVHATNDAIAKLGGQPFDNMEREYKSLNAWPGSVHDVERIAADEQALDEIDRCCEPTGDLLRPLVTAHTTRDPIVPYWHERLYAEKVSLGGGLSPIGLAVRRYGHCALTMAELLEAFATLVQEVRGVERRSVEDLLAEWRLVIDLGKDVRPHHADRGR